MASSFSCFEDGQRQKSGEGKKKQNKQKTLLLGLKNELLTFLRRVLIHCLT